MGPNGSAVHWNGDCYVTDLLGHRIRAARRRGRCSPWWTPYEGGSCSGAPNDLTFHPSGAIYFTAPKGHYAEDPPPGRVYRLGPGGDLRLAADVPCAQRGERERGRRRLRDGCRGGGGGPHAGQRDLREGQDKLWAVATECAGGAWVGAAFYVAGHGSYRVRLYVTPEGETTWIFPVAHEKPANCC